MSSKYPISTNRLEAFSDGVIAIIITIMVFDLKVENKSIDTTIWSDLTLLLPKFISYFLSFLMLSIMWVNHHQIFHQIKLIDRSLLWYNIHLLFWMSLIPFGTNFIGANPLLWQASFIYYMLFFMCTISFTLLRNYVIRKELLHDNISKSAHIRIRNKNLIALLVYLTAAVMSYFSVYISFILFLIVPLMYFIPEKITLENTEI